MVQYIHCPACAERFNLHPDDEAMGLKMRKVKGKACKPPVHQITVSTDKGVDSVTDLSTLVCDLCANSIPDGSPAVAVTMWRGPEPEQWELHYLKDIEHGQQAQEKIKR